MSAASRLAPASFLKLSADVALSYGFRPARELFPMRGAHSFNSVLHASNQILNSRPTEPVRALYATHTPSHMPSSMVPRETGEIGLVVSGTSETVGEVLLLKTSVAILKEWGANVTRVRVNALGDKDSKARFSRELSLYLRKHQNDLHPTCRDMVSQNPFGAYMCAAGVCREVLQEGPRSMNFLSEKSRVHFREFLEHVEQLGLPYELDDLLVGDEREPRMLFAIDLEGEDATVVGSLGGRYDDYLRRLTGRKEGSALHASIYFRKKGLTASHFQVQSPRVKPKIFFVQLGTRAKLQGLSVLDTLRQARVPVLQSFDAQQFSPQLAAAKSAGVSHLIIMGQREALDGTVLVRSMQNSSQTAIPLSQLPRFLKTLK